MILKYSFGKVKNTEAVVLNIPAEKNATPEFLGKYNEEDKSFTYKLQKDDAIYGLGENVRGINKRGWIYESRNSDNPNHLETNRSLYSSHNFFIVKGKESFGVFIDFPGIVTFDFGYSEIDSLKIQLKESDFDLYIIKGESLNHICSEFRKLTGKSYIPPKWAFGYQQSRWSYMNEDEIREVVKEHKKHKIPLESVYMDIDYMERYKDFTIDNEKFPDFENFVKEMKDQGIHLVPIIDAGVKIEEGYPLYEEGVENNYFCKNEDGSDFIGGVWPGKVHFPDFLNKDARHWFGYKYKFLTDKGIDGFWNDMNEPAIFYSQSNLEYVLDEISKFKGENIDNEKYSKLHNLVGSLINNEEDYKRFYHNFNGEKVRHDKVHNLYGYMMTRAAGEALQDISDKRILLFSRSSYTGMHRYGGIWYGDNMSWWSHLEMNIHMLPSVNMMGFLYSGADTGGFGGDVTEDLLIRWLELSIFTPLLRNHCAIGCRRQEAYRFKNIDLMRNLINLRYSLIPYLYSEFVKAALNDKMLIHPLSFIFENDEMAKEVEDQLFIGENLMIAPVYKQNVKGRYVYLPEKMKMIRFRTYKDYDEEILEKGHHYIEMPLGTVVIFVRDNAVIPLVEPADNTEKLDMSTIRFIGFPSEGKEYELYNDDGYSKITDYEKNLVKYKMDSRGKLI